MVASVYQHEKDAAFFAERAANTAHWGRAIQKKVEPSAQAPENILQCPYYPDTLPQQLFGEFPEFMRSMFAKKYELRAEDDRPLWSPKINVGEEQQNGGDKDSGRARCALTPERRIDV